MFSVLAQRSANLLSFSNDTTFANARVCYLYSLKLVLPLRMTFLFGQHFRLITIRSGYHLYRIMTKYGYFIEEVKEKQ